MVEVLVSVSLRGLHLTMAQGFLSMLHSTKTAYTQRKKPVALYEWLLNRYAKPNDIILDTHVGSASSLMACYNTNHKFVGFELDEYYYKVSKQRLDTEMAQMRLSDYI